MALAFSAATDRVEVADSATVRNLTAATYIAWAYLSGTANARFCQKGTAPAVNYRQFGVASAALTVQVFRPTVVTNASAALTNFAAWGTNKWCFFAGVHDTAGVNGDQKLYMGDLTTLAAEPSSYNITQVVGSGATGDNSASIQYLANGGTGTGPTLPGRIAILQIYNRVLTQAEIQSLQFKPRVISGCVGYWIMGNDATVTQTDYSGNANAGTVTGGTVADHVPLPPAFSVDARSLLRAQYAQALAGSEPTATGVVTRLYQALRALAGAQPTPTGVASRLYHALRALAGSEPTATGTTTRLYQALRSLTGSEPPAAGTVTALLVFIRALVGNQPTATGIVTRAAGTFARALAGAQQAATGLATRVFQTVRSMAGAQPTATGVLIAAAVAGFLAHISYRIGRPRE